MLEYVSRHGATGPRWNGSHEVKDAGLIYLKVDPFLDPIRNDPRYAALLRRLNFP